MRPCEKCLENNWSFEIIEGFVRATCNLCGYEVEFLTKKYNQSNCKEYANHKIQRRNK